MKMAIPPNLLENGRFNPADEELRHTEYVKDRKII